MDDKTIKTGMSISALVAAAAACIPCCLALAAPLLAWLGISGAAMVQTGEYLAVGALAALGTGAWLLYRARRRARETGMCGASGTCGCGRS